jgi:hypothetical protein
MKLSCRFTAATQETLSTFTDVALAGFTSPLKRTPHQHFFARTTIVANNAFGKNRAVNGNDIELSDWLDHFQSLCRIASRMANQKPGITSAAHPGGISLGWQANVDTEKIRHHDQCQLRRHHQDDP